MTVSTVHLPRRDYPDSDPDDAEHRNRFPTRFRDYTLSIFMAMAVSAGQVMSHRNVLDSLAETYVAPSMYRWYYSMFPLELVTWYYERCISNDFS